MLRRLLIPGILTLALAAPLLAEREAGIEAFRNKDFAKAVEEFRELVAAAPEDWQGHFLLGLALEQVGRGEDALLHVGTALELSPEDLAVRLALARIHSHLGQYSEAAALLKDADGDTLPLDPRTAFYQLRGQARYKSDDLEGAAEDLGKLAQLRPTDTQIQYLFGVVAASTGRIDAAIEAIRRAKLLSPESREINLVLARFLLKKATSAEPGEKQAAYREVATIAAEAAEAYPAHDNFIVLAIAQLGSQDYSAAIDAARSAVGTAEADWLGHYYLGRAYSGYQEYENAEAPLQAALTRAAEPKDQGLVWWQLGTVYEHLGRAGEAARAYREAAALGVEDSTDDPVSPFCTPRSECCEVCTTGKACGDSCSSSGEECSQGEGCACDSWEVCG